MELYPELQIGVVGQQSQPRLESLLMLKATGRNNIITLNLKTMKTNKMSLANIEGKLSRAEMKNIMAGSGTGCYKCCYPNGGACSECVFSYSTAPCKYGSVLTGCSGC